MQQPEEDHKGIEADKEHSLTCIQPCIHSAAPSEGVDPLGEIEVENFLNTLVDIAFAIAARTSTEEQADQEQEKKK